MHEHVGEPELLDPCDGVDEPVDDPRRTGAVDRQPLAEHRIVEHVGQLARDLDQRAAQRASGGEQILLAAARRSPAAARGARTPPGARARRASRRRASPRAASIPSPASHATTPCRGTGRQFGDERSHRRLVPKVLEHRLEPVAAAAPSRPASPPRSPSGDAGRSAVGGGSCASARARSIQAHARSYQPGRVHGARSGSGTARPSRSSIHSVRRGASSGSISSVAPRHVGLVPTVRRRPRGIGLRQLDVGRDDVARRVRTALVDVEVDDVAVEAERRQHGARHGADGRVAGLDREPDRRHVAIAVDQDRSRRAPRHDEPDDPELLVHASVDGSSTSSKSSANAGGRPSRLAVIASTWLGVPINDRITRRSSANCSAAPSVNIRLNRRLAPRTPFGVARRDLTCQRHRVVVRLLAEARHESELVAFAGVEHPRRVRQLAGDVVADQPA